MALRLPIKYKFQINVLRNFQGEKRCCFEAASTTIELEENVPEEIDYSLDEVFAGISIDDFFEESLKLIVSYFSLVT